MKKYAGVTRGDILLMSVILLAAVLLLLQPLLKAPAAAAEIVLSETGDVRVVSLAADAQYTFTAHGITLTVSVADGAVFVSQSDCRDSVCVNTPPISKPGQSIVCAPAGVIVRITGEEAMVDGVSG